MQNTRIKSNQHATKLHLCTFKTLKFTTYINAWKQQAPHKNR